MLDLDLICDVGGPLLNFYERVAGCPQTVFRVVTHNMADYDPQTEPLVDVMNSWRQRFPHCQLMSVGDADRRISLSAWAEAIDPALSAPDFAALEDYRNELPESSLRSWSGLRFFSGFLRKRSQPSAERFAGAWAAVSALHSPQDEVHEQERLLAGETLLNPTAHVVTGVSQMQCYWRWRGELCEQRFEMASAALVDEFYETGRSLQDDLCRRAQSASGIELQFIRREFDRLRHLGLILAR